MESSAPQLCMNSWENCDSCPTIMIILHIYEVPIICMVKNLLIEIIILFNPINVCVYKSWVNIHKIKKLCVVCGVCVCGVCVVCVCVVCVECGVCE